MSKPLTFEESGLRTGLANDLAAGPDLDDTARRTLAELADRAAAQTQKFGGLTEELEALLELVRQRVVVFEGRRDQMIAKTVEFRRRSKRSTPEQPPIGDPSLDRPDAFTTPAKVAAVRPLRKVFTCGPSTTPIEDVRFSLAVEVHGE